MKVTESDIYLAILSQRGKTRDYAKLHGTPGQSEDLITPDFSHDDIKAQLRSLRERGLVENEGIVGREEHLEFKFFLTSSGEEAMAPLEDLGRAITPYD